MPIKVSPLSLTLSLSLSLLASACATEQGGSNADKQDSLGDVSSLEIGLPGEGFEVQVNSASIDGDRLTIEMSHGGGCGEHDYHLSWDHQLAFNDSHDIEAQLRVRDVTDDFCESFVTTSATFDLSVMKDEIPFVSADIHLLVEDVAGAIYSWDLDAPQTQTKPLQIGDAPLESRGTTINDVRLEGTDMVIDVSYSGGCEQHSFDLFWSGAALETAPPQGVVVLSHTGPADFCEAFLSESLRFDVSTMEGMIVRLEGFDAPFCVGFQDAFHCD